MMTASKSGTFVSNPGDCSPVDQKSNQQPQRDQTGGYKQAKKADETSAEPELRDLLGRPKKPTVGGINPGYDGYD